MQTTASPDPARALLLESYGVAIIAFAFAVGAYVAFGPATTVHEINAYGEIARNLLEGRGFRTSPIQGRQRCPRVDLQGRL